MHGRLHRADDGRAREPRQRSAFSEFGASSREGTARSRALVAANDMKFPAPFEVNPSRSRACIAGVPSTRALPRTGGRASSAFGWDVLLAIDPKSFSL